MVNGRLTPGPGWPQRPSGARTARQNRRAERSPDRVIRQEDIATVQFKVVRAAECGYNSYRPLALGSLAAGPLGIRVTPNRTNPSSFANRTNPT